MGSFSFTEATGLFAKDRLCLDLGESNSLVLGDAVRMRNLDFLLFKF
jgi:hypothetical protein